jgi:hypothetical protein
MNDYDEQLSGGTLPELSEEERLKLESEIEGYDNRLDELAGPEEVTQPEAEATAPVQQEQAQPVQQEVQPTEEPQQAEALLDNMTGNEVLDENLPEVTKAGLTMATGIADFAVDAFNLVTRQEARKVPEFENEVAQSMREMSSIVLPTLALSGTGSAALASRTKNIKFLANPFVKWLGNTAFGAGVGAAVDYTVEINQTDDNLTGSLKKSFPRTFGWIPDNIATLDSDSPDIKRIKNVTEGVYLGAGSDLLLGATKFASNMVGMVKAASYIPESEKAVKWFADNVEIKNTPEEVVEASAAKRSDALDEVGGYNFEKSVNVDDPVFGYHDMYDYTEQGIRSVDDLGIVGASIDVVRIDKNYDSNYGRVGSVVSDAALKFGLESSGNQEMIIRGLAEGLKDAGEYGYQTASGRYISHAEIMETGAKLADDFYEMDLQELQRSIYPGSIYQGKDPDTGTPALKVEALAGVMGAIKKYMDDFINMDLAKAQAYVGTSLGGQVSDMAQGMRLTEGTAAIDRAQEQILDRVEFLMAQQGMAKYVRGRALNMTNMWNRMTVKGSDAFNLAEAKRLENLIKDEKNGTLTAMEKIKQESKETINNLREISKSDPEMLAPLMMGYELSDGNIKTIYALNEYVKESTGVLRKAFYDGNPEIPSVVLKGFYANLYNSTLSAFATPIKAGISATHLLVERPLRIVGGALAGGDKETVRRGMYQYKNIQEAVSKSTEYMNQVFQRSALDPNVVAARDDLGLKNQAQMDLLNAFADGKAKQGEYGPQAMMQQINDMNDLANHPWLRFGTRSMQATDGFTKSMIGMAEARANAFDKVTDGGRLALDEAKADALAADYYKEMFNEKGILNNKAVDNIAGEISMNLDNNGTRITSELINRLPVLKPFMLFTKTPLNELALSLGYRPSNPVKIFLEDSAAFKKPFEDMSGPEVAELLKSKKIEVGPHNIRAKYNEIRADLKGRRALGNIAVGGAVALFMDDRITGNGLYNRQKQKLRDKTQRPRRSIKGLDDKWYSYEGLGPLTNWLALTTDVMDNMETLSAHEQGTTLKKMAFVLAASVTDKTMLAGIQPLLDVVRGDVGAINRWTSSFLSSATLRGSSQMAELGRLLDPGRKQVENEFTAMVQNRLPLLKSALPKEYDWIDGGEVGVPDSFMARVWNTYTPWKITGEISPEKEYLHEVEFDATPSLRTDGKGNPLTAAMQSEVLNYMGEQKLFQKGIQRVMKRYPAKKFREMYREAEKEGFKPDAGEFASVHRELKKELRKAMRKAMDSSASLTEMQRKSRVQETVGNYLKSGDIESATEYMEYMEENFSY